MEGFLTDEQREMMKVATQTADNLPPSQKPHSILLTNHHLSKPSAAGKASGGSNAVKHRKSHAGRSIRSKKGELLLLLVWICTLCSSASCDRYILFQMGVVGKELGENLLTLMETITLTGMILIMTVER